MTTMTSRGGFVFRAPLREPRSGRETIAFAGCHARQPFQDIGEVVPRRDAQAAAVLHEGVEDRGLLPGLPAADEHPVLRPQLCPTVGVRRPACVHHLPAMT